VRLRDFEEFFPGFGESNVESGFSEAAALQKELKSERRLAGSGHTLNEVKPVGRKTSVKNLIEPEDAGLNTRFRLMLG
jgi:hypothetical protein